MVAIIICLSISIILLCASMVLSAMASSHAKKGNTVDAQKYAMWSALVSGISVFTLVVVLIIYANSGKIATAGQSALQSAHGQLGTYLAKQQ